MLVVVALRRSRRQLAQLLEHSTPINRTTSDDRAAGARGLAPVRALLGPLDSKARRGVQTVDRVAIARMQCVRMIERIGCIP